MATGKQINLRFAQTEIDRLEEIAARDGVSSTEFIRSTIRAIFFSSASEQAKFLEQHAYQKNLKKIPLQEVLNDWQAILTQLEGYGVTPEEFEQNWLHMIQTVKKIGLDIKGDPDEIFKRAARLGAVQTVVNAVGAKSEVVRQKATEDLLDRAGYKPVERIEIDRVGSLSNGELKALLWSELVGEFGLQGQEWVKSGFIWMLNECLRASLEIFPQHHEELLKALKELINRNASIAKKKLNGGGRGTPISITAGERK